uniref:NADH dehydrogenase subunit 6 n=1 Tax=Artyfechinostomum malayanum TaxID=2750923 RepID=UPI002176BD19|nr:NADH dehydrogenase subunit 6 [Artyfechinostomum malayanum]UUF68166.1 NADH dehydrogenase subunit 6 [Artyfechinostomum malayanum]
MVGAVLSGIYFGCLLSFSFISHPVVYCVLLLTSALSVGGLVYTTVGFSWYIAVFCLVYVGGVYVLFIFVSIHSPNPVAKAGGSSFVPAILFGAFFCVVVSFLFPVPSVVDGSNYLCSYFEGFSYCLFCLVLMVGFISISVVVSGKGSFFR